MLVVFHLDLLPVILLAQKCTKKSGFFGSPTEPQNSGVTRILCAPLKDYIPCVSSHVSARLGRRTRRRRTMEDSLVDCPTCSSENQGSAALETSVMRASVPYLRKGVSQEAVC